MLNKLVFLLVMVISVEGAMIAGTRFKEPDEASFPSSAAGDAHDRCGNNLPLTPR
jgi:hypothetical protein